jgi:hypothetical protein
LVFSELSHADHEAVENMDTDAGHSTEDTATISHIAPPGKEGLDISHEGGEHEVFEDLIEMLAQSLQLCTKSNTPMEYSNVKTG